jgi:hypothetical protein
MVVKNIRWYADDDYNVSNIINKLTEYLNKKMITQ